MSNKINGLIEFGSLRLDPQKRILWFEDRQIQLPLKEIEVLCALVEGRGDLVTKDELLEKVWKDSFVEESNLSRQIYMLRKTLKDLGMEGLIETVPRRGYRFAGEVRDYDDNAITVEKYTQSRTLIEIEEIPEEKPEKTEQKRRVSRWVSRSLTHGMMAASALIAVTVLIGVATFSAYRNSSGAGSALGIRSLAVLPFRTIDTSDGSTDQNLGLADILITRLSNVKEISIRSLSAVSGFDHQDAVGFGRDLKTDAVLEGSIYRTPEKVRVTARLRRTTDGSILWTGEFERLPREEIKLQDEIALQVVNALAVNLTNNERAAISRPLTVSLSASSLYQKGRVEWNKRNWEGMVEAERLFRNAAEEDPNFALAYLGLADTLAMSPPRSTEMFAALQKALELDPNLGEAYASLGFYQMFYKWEWRSAEETFKKSIDLSELRYGPPLVRAASGS